MWYCIDVLVLLTINPLMVYLNDEEFRMNDLENKCLFVVNVIWCQIQSIFHSQSDNFQFSFFLRPYFQNLFLRSRDS